MCDHVPGLAGCLPQNEIDVSTAGHRAKRLEDDLRVGLKNDEGSVEEGKRGVRARCRANGVALLDEVVRRCRREVAGPVTDLDAPLEDRQVRPRRDDGGLIQEDACAGQDQQEGCGQRGDDCERTARPLLGELRYRNEWHDRGRVRSLDRIADFSEGRRDDLELDASEHVLRFALCRFIERVGHREGRRRASEFDECNPAELAEPPRQLTHDRGLRPDTERGDRVAAHASDRIRERLLVDETGAENRVRQGLSSRAHAVEVLDLTRGEDLVGDQDLRELGLRAGRLAARCLRCRDARGGANDAHDLLRRLVLGDVRGRARGEREVADAGIQREEDDLGRGEVVAEHARDLEAGHARHRVVEHDHVGAKL